MLSVPRPHTSISSLDKAVDQVLGFIRDYLSRLKQEGYGNLKEFSKLCQLSNKNMTNYLSYGPGSDPMFRTTFKVLWGILGTNPIKLTPDHTADDFAWYLKGKALCGDRIERLVTICERQHKLEPDHMALIDFALESAYRRATGRGVDKKRQNTPWFVPDKNGNPVGG